MVKVLGVDLASGEWTNNGTAVLGFEPGEVAFRELLVPALSWPDCRLTPEALASAIDDFARSNHISAVSLDGPQGWRDPSTRNDLPGVGRRCEYLCKTQCKTGEYGHSYPGSQRRWIEFSIRVFELLLSRPDVALADPTRPRVPPHAGYLLLECYPTSIWKRSGLRPLPGKAKAPALAPYLKAL